MFVQDRAMIWTCRLASDMSSSALPKTRGRAALPSKALIDVQPADGPRFLKRGAPIETWDAVIWNRHA
jgi:hypothetical protein